MGRYGKQEAKQKHNPPVRTQTYGEIALVLSPTYPVYLRFRFPAGRARGMPISSLVVFFSLSLPNQQPIWEQAMRWNAYCYFFTVVQV